MVPNYTKQGKILEPLTHAQFLSGMNKGTFHNPRHRSYVTLLYYTGVRRGEALRATPEQFQITDSFVFFDVLKRLKHGRHTPPLPLPTKADYIPLIVKDVEATKPKKRVWAFTSRTAYNAVARVFYYPHHFRLSRITRFFLEKKSIGEVQNWTGLTLTSLNYYIGLADLRAMGESLGDSGGA